MTKELDSNEKMNLLFEQNYALAQEFAVNSQEFLDRIIAADPEAAEKCFNASELEICCIDGRLQQGNLAIAGSGCLFEQPADALRNAMRVAQTQGSIISGLTSHEHCGAAGMKQIEAQQYSVEIAEQVQLPYTGHLSVDLPEFHDEVVIYYSGTQSIGLQHVTGLPRGFRISRKYYPTAEDAVHEAGVAIQIAFGDHGLGSRFTSEKPLIIIALGDANNQQFSAGSLAQEIAELKSDRVRIVQANYDVETSGEVLPIAA